MPKVEVEDHHERLAVVERDVQNLNEQVGSIANNVNQLTALQSRTQNDIGRIGQGIESLEKLIRSDRDTVQGEIREISREQRASKQTNYPLLGLIVSILGVVGGGFVYAMTRPGELTNEHQSADIRELKEYRDRAMEREFQAAFERGRQSAKENQK